MMRMMKRLAIVLGALGLAGSLLLAAVPAAAAPIYMADSPQQEICNGITGTNTCSDGTAQLNQLITAGINILSSVIGIAAVVVLMISGLRFITANGDPAKVTAAKNGIMYALIGLAVVALAQLLVHYVLNVAINTQKP